MSVGVYDIPDCLVGDSLHRFSKCAAFPDTAAGIDDGDGIAANHKSNIGYGPLVLSIHQFVGAEVNVNARRHLADWEWINAFLGIGRRRRLGERRDGKAYADPYHRIEAARKEHRDTFAQLPLRCSQRKSVLLESNGFSVGLRGCERAGSGGVVRYSIAPVLRDRR
jgi:hypothetical protein